MIKNTLDIINSPKYESSKFTLKYKELLDRDGYCLLPPDKSYWEWIGANPEDIRAIINSLLNKEVHSSVFKKVPPISHSSIYLFIYLQLLKEDASLFQGTSQYNRYSKLFLAVISDNKEELQLLGVEEGDLGTHSCRNGVATMVAAGCTVSPPIVSICIREGWVMGGFKDRYLKRESAGDQYVGRCASCLDQLDKSFAVSPPYLDYSHLDDVERFVMKSKINNWLKDRILQWGSVPARTYELIDFLFSSICYHQEYLNLNLHTECRFRASSFFKDIPQEFLD